MDNDPRCNCNCNCFSWVVSNFKIDFKILLLTFKALHNKAPEYICNLITVHESLCNLRSLVHDNLLLVEPKTSRLVSYSDRAFCKAAPKLWNRLAIKGYQTQQIYQSL